MTIDKPPTKARAYMLGYADGKADYCVCKDCGCKHLVWEKSCPYCRRILELEAGNDQLKARELGYIQSLRELEEAAVLVHSSAEHWEDLAVELEAENQKLQALLRDAVHRIGTEGFDAKWQEAAKAALGVESST